MKYEPKRIILSAILSILWSITMWSKTFNPGHELMVTILILVLILVTAAAVFFFIFGPLVEIFCNHIEKNKK